jgi:hypothetical protein
MSTHSPRKAQWLYAPLALLVLFMSRFARERTHARYDMHWTQHWKILMGGHSLVMVFRKPE